MKDLANVKQQTRPDYESEGESVEMQFDLEKL